MEPLTLYELTKRFRLVAGYHEECYGMYVREELWCYYLYQIGPSLARPGQVIVETEEILKTDVATFLEREDGIRFRPIKATAKAVMNMSGFNESCVEAYEDFLAAYNAVTLDGIMKIVRVE